MDFFEHSFSFPLLNTPHLRVWCVAIARIEEWLNYMMYLSPYKARRAKSISSVVGFLKATPSCGSCLFRIMGTPTPDHLKVKYRMSGERMVVVHAYFFPGLAREQTPVHL